MIPWRRWLIVALFLAGYTALMAVVGTAAVCFLISPGDTGICVRDMLVDWDFLTDRGWWYYVGVPIVLLVVTQAMFLTPCVRRPPSGSGHRRSLRISVIGAALLGAVLTIAMLFAVFAMIDLARGDLHPDQQHAGYRVVFYGLLPLSWMVWSVVLIGFARRRKREGPTQRLLGLLAGGTVAELLLFLPLDAMVRSRTDCYCDTKGFMAIALAVWSLLWLTGPGIVLLLSVRARQRLWSRGHCWNCGFEKGPTPGEQCPECGFRWKQ